MADDRKTHVRRVHAKDEKGVKQEDVWLDIEVIDEMWSNGSGTIVHSKKPGNSILKEAVRRINDQIKGQGIHYVFDTENEGRNTTPTNVVNPQDKNQFVEVEVTDELPVRLILEKTKFNWIRRIKWKNGDENTSRKTKRRRVFHREVDTQVAGDLDSDRGVDTSEYDKAVGGSGGGEIDKDQYVDTEIVVETHHTRNEQAIWVGSVLRWHPENSPLQAGGSEGEGAEGGDPVRLDPLQTIVNVSWGDGLPVEFDKKKPPQGGEPQPPPDKGKGQFGHVLWQGQPIKMSKGTISMWFRVPKETIESIKYEPESALDALKNMIPILAFSGQHTGPWTDFYQPIINTFTYNANPIPPYLPPDYQPFPYTGNIPGPTVQLPYWPCVIGVRVDKDGGATLAVVLQTMDVGKPENTNSALVAADGKMGESGPEAGHLFGPTKLYWENASDADAKMEWFEPNSFGPEVKPDVWHHVLLSWDLGRSNSAFGNAESRDDPPSNRQFHEYFTAKSTMYCAFDDKNLKKNDLPTGEWVDGFGDNEIACYSCWHFAGATYFTDTEHYFGFPSYTVTFANGIQMDTVAVPSEPKYKNWIQTNVSSRDPPTYETKELEVLKKIEVAELQIFSDLLLDTSNERNRRAFIDIERPGSDAPDIAGTDEAKDLMAPVDPKKTEEILGKRPDILLHKTPNWKKGKNTGKIGLERNPEEGDKIIEAGQFKPTEAIKKWTPDPRLLAEKGRNDDNPLPGAGP